MQHQLAQGCQILDVVEAGTRVILLAEDDVVGKADPEEVPFTQVEIEPQDDGVVVRRPVADVIVALASVSSQPSQITRSPLSRLPS